MKNIFGINITENKKNDTPDGEIFLNNSASSELETALDRHIGFIGEVEKKLYLPLWLRVIKTISGYLTIVIVINLFRIPIAQAYQNAPYLLYGTAILFIIWFSLFVADIIRLKKIKKSDEYSEMINSIESNIDSLSKVLQEEFNIPPDAKNVDMLLFTYKIKRGKVKIKSNGIAMFVNLVCTVYSQDNSLHILSSRKEWAIPLDSIIEIEKINKRTSIHAWYKDTPFNKGEYKKYKMYANNSGVIFFKSYYNILIKHGEDEYGLFIPPYELDTMSSLIKLEPKERCTE